MPENKICQTTMEMEEKLRMLQRKLWTFGPGFEQKGAKLKPSELQMVVF